MSHGPSCGAHNLSSSVQSVKQSSSRQTDFKCRSPLHTCKRCGGSESDSNKGELVPCRRCPKAYHEHCMPAPLLDTCIPGKNRVQRIWIAQFKDGAHKCFQIVIRQSVQALAYAWVHKANDGKLIIIASHCISVCCILCRCNAH